MHTLGPLRDILSAPRVAWTERPAAMLAALLHPLRPEDAARVQGMVQACHDCETPLHHERAATEAAVTAAV